MTMALPEMEGLRSALEREAYRLTANRDEAQDLAQDCLILLVQRWPSLRSLDSIHAWCRTVLRNLFRQRLRRRWYAEVLGTDGLPEATFDPWPAVDVGLHVDGALGMLPTRIGRATRSFCLLGHGIATIAASEGRPEGTIKRWLHEGREALRMSLAETAGETPVARIYGSNWLDDARENIVKAVATAGYSPVLSELGEEPLPHGAALFVLGEQAGCRTGLEFTLAIRGTRETAATPVLLFGPPRYTAMLAAWQAGADAYLTNPSSDEVVDLLVKLRETTPSRSGP